jgi:hypothetical protein
MIYLMEKDINCIHGMMMKNIKRVDMLLVLLLLIVKMEIYKLNII